MTSGRSHTGLLVAGLALVVAAWSWLQPLYIELPLAAPIGGTAVAAGALAIIAGAGCGSRRAGAVFAAAVVVTTGLANELLVRIEATVQPMVELFSWAAFALARAAGERCAVVDGSLLIDAREGAFGFAPTSGLIALRPLVAFWIAGGLLLGALRPARAGGALAQLLLVGLGVFALRYALAVIGYVGIEGVLAERRHVPLSAFWDPWTILAALALSSALWRVSLPAGGALRIEWRLASLALVTAAGVVCGAVLGWRDPGVPKAGCVLIDDRLSGVWEPAARLLTKDRFGDFSTYSFASLTEHLSRRYAVTVNHERTYDADYLSGFDVLVLKTLHEPLTPVETDAIRRWVAAGGGLFAISDHTDLGGMSTYLNDLLEPMGIRFAFDSVTGSSGRSVNVWSEPWLPEHPVTRGLDGFSFLTSSSIELWGDAEPVLTLRQAVSQPGDYSGRSNFGSMGPRPSRGHGALVAAAAAEHGRGRVLCMSDSTVLSSFSYYRDHHDAFVLRAVTWLNRRVSGTSWIVVTLGALAVVAFLVALRLSRPAAPELVLLVPGFLVGTAVGALATATIQGKALVTPNGPAGVTRIGIVQEGGRAALPPVLGQRPELPNGWNLSTFVQMPQRLGAETAVIPRDATLLDGFDVLMLLNPADGLDAWKEGWVRDVRDWVHRGGSLIVTQLRGGPGPVYAEGVELRRSAAPTSDVQVLTGTLGEGEVVYLVGSEELDLDGLGHCMGYPTERQRGRLETVYFALEELAGVRAPDRRTYVP